jgi:hypothetical protein
MRAVFLCCTWFSWSIHPLWIDVTQGWGMAALMCKCEKNTSRTLALQTLLSDDFVKIRTMQLNGSSGQTEVVGLALWQLLLGCYC